jgi:hypothetical protein
VHDPGSDPGSDAELQPNPISANYDALLGKRLHNYGKSPCLMGKSTINGSFSIAMLNYQRVSLKSGKK